MCAMCAMCGRLLAIVRQLTCYVSFFKTLLQIRSDQSALPPAAQATRDPPGARAAPGAQEVRPVRPMRLARPARPARRGVTILRIVLRRRWLRRGRRRTASWNGTVYIRWKKRKEQKRKEQKRKRCGGDAAVLSYCLLSTVYCLTVYCFLSTVLQDTALSIWKPGSLCVVWWCVL